MGYQGKGTALVVMANNDVYYVTDREAQEIQRAVIEDDPTAFIEVTDSKSGARIVLNTSLVSSIVVRGADDARR